MLPDEKEWSAVNLLLKQQGLSPIVILNEININDYVWLTLEASKSLRLTIQTLIDDCQRKQNLVNELMSTNADLREQLKSYSLNIKNSNHVIEEMSRILGNHFSSIKKYSDEEILQTFKLYKDNPDIDKKKKINYSQRINKLNLIRPTQSDSEMLPKNAEDNCILIKKIDQLRLEIKALKRDQEKTYKANLVTRKQDFESIFKELYVNDIPSAIQKIRSMTNKHHNHEALKQFIYNIYEILNNGDKNINLLDKHAITTDKNLHNMKIMISEMDNQITLIPEMIKHINNVSLTLVPHRLVHPLDMNADIHQINNFLMEVSVQKFGYQTEIRPVKDEKVTSETLYSIIEYIQMLFGIKSIKGMYAGMSSIYRRLAEQENMMKSLQMLLSPNDKMTSSKLVAVVTYLSHQDQNNNHHLDDELKRIHDIMEKQESYISIFQNMVVKLQTILSLNSPDEILPKVKQLIEQQKIIKD